MRLYIREEFLQFRVRQRFDEHIEHPRRVHIGIARIGGQETGYEIFAFLLRHGNPIACQTVLSISLSHNDGTTIQQAGRKKIAHFLTQNRN